MGPCATAGAQMLAARPCFSASQSMLTSRAAVSRIDLALGASSFANCPRISCSRSLGSSRSGAVAVRAVSGEGSSSGLPIDLRGEQCQEWWQLCLVLLCMCKEKLCNSTSHLVVILFRFYRIVRYSYRFSALEVNTIHLLAFAGLF